MCRKGITKKIPFQLRLIGITRVNRFCLLYNKKGNVQIFNALALTIKSLCRILILRNLRSCLLQQPLHSID